MGNKVIFCPRCGFQNDATAKFCVNCGFQLPQTDVSAKTPPVQETSSDSHAVHRVRDYPYTVILGIGLAGILAMVHLLLGLAALVLFFGIVRRNGSGIENAMAKRVRQPVASVGIRSLAAAVAGAIVLLSSFMGTFFQFNMATLRQSLGLAFDRTMGETNFSQSIGETITRYGGTLNHSLSTQIRYVWPPLFSESLSTDEIEALLIILAVGPVLVVLGFLFRGWFSRIVMFLGALAAGVCYGFIFYISVAGINYARPEVQRLVRSFLGFGASAVVAFIGVVLILILTFLNLLPRAKTQEPLRLE
ncbi:zinc ribbon domain-containing protein [Schleiferilactobacillus shenzhenensis]|uniref:Zinc-ribbon domain-containing protein n=1 Tax=Schleiferilactobacillus shenzhenensis LY-73 TaxID=1231336 RepID=U4TIL5_9LACO|nr:zinc ribbon domain-containing protein [Schleiferilactobacillus shenzhenensis]ERL64656.1 hypothetical protein L248_0713 [Schleiferilactobacillus shenzhenensis LY-73]